MARSSDAPIKQIAEDFGISDASLYNWLKQSDSNNGKRQGLTSAEADEIGSDEDTSAAVGAGERDPAKLLRSSP